MQNRAQMKESKCAKDILKCANEKRRNRTMAHRTNSSRSECRAQTDPANLTTNVALNSFFVACICDKQRRTSNNKPITNNEPTTTEPRQAFNKQQQNHDKHFTNNNRTTTSILPTTTEPRQAFYQQQQNHDKHFTNNNRTTTSILPTTTEPRQAFYQQQQNHDKHWTNNNRTTQKEPKK